MKTSINVGERGNSCGSPQQPLLWDQPSTDPTNRLKAAMREALSACPLSRMKVVADMNAIASVEGMTCGGRGQKVTEDLLDKWCAPGSTAYVIPVRFIPLFCRVVGSLLPLRALTAPVGANVINGDDAKLLEWARLEIARRRLGKDARRLAQEVGIV